MPSADPTERPVFRRARIRLTAWYVGVLAVFLAALGGSVYLLQKRQLERNIDNGLKVTARLAVHDWRHQRRTLPNVTAVNEGLRYYVLYTDGTSTQGRAVEPTARAFVLGLPNQPGARAALRYGSDMRTVATAAGRLRVYSLQVTPLLVAQVARSLEPEDQSLDNLLAVLLIGSAGSLVLAAAGGWFLAGKSLAPLREAFDRQHVFVADASHELRTPLAVIRANAEFLQAGQPDSVEIADIVSETDRLSALVDALLALARGEAADRPQRDLFDLGTVVEGSVEAMQALAGERGVSLAVEATHGVHVQGDREQLRQLVVILVDNALRYTPAGGAVEVEVGRSADHATVSVRDTGIGIEQAVLSRVFDRFYRADDARNRDSGGAGLGLAIARQLVEEHGGRITAESTPGHGSTFTVRLPLAAPRSRTGMPV
jgi:signal transduction histidine kinase